MEYSLKFISAVGLVLILLSCNAKSGSGTLFISDGSSTVSVSNYNVQFGSSSNKPIEGGLRLIISELLEISKTVQNVKGTATFIFRCEPDGLIRWMAAGESDLLPDRQEELTNRLTEQLMKKRIKFPALGEVTMIEATFRFE